MRELKMPERYLINIVAIVLFLIVGNGLIKSGMFGRAQQAVIMQIGIYIILAVSLNIVTGYLGELPLGQAGFMAAGGYAAALFWKSGLLSGFSSFILGLIIGGAVAGLLGVIIGVPTLRLNGDYLAIVALGFSEIIRIVIVNCSKITGGAQGLKKIPKFANFLSVYATVVVVCAIIHTFINSRHGRAILAIRENEIAAESCGINTNRYKVLAFSLSAFFTGIAGALYATNQTILAPSEFGFMKSIEVLVMVVLGGMGSMIGSIVAAGLLTYLPLLLQQVLKGFNDYRMILYSSLLILIMIFKPSGLFGSYDFSLSDFIQKIFVKKSRSEGDLQNDSARSA